MSTLMRAHTLRATILLAVVALMLVLTGCATVAPPPTAQTVVPPLAAQPQRTIVVVGDGTTRVAANIARLSLGVEVVDEDVLVANRTASETVETVLAALAELAISGEDVKPFAYNVYAERYYPGYDIADPGTPPQMPPANEQTRYRVSHQLHVLIRDLDSIAGVVTAVIEAGGNDVYIYGIDHLYDDPASLEPAARARAVADAKQKAEAIAERIGVELGPPISISEFVQGSYSSWDGLVPTIWPGDIQFYKQLQVTYAIKDADAQPAAAAATPAVTAAALANTPGSVTVHGGDDASLRAFLTHYFTPHYPPQEAVTTDIYVNQLPADMPFAFEVPEDMRVVGSVVTTGPYANTQLLLTFAGEAGERINMLRQQLESQGYTRPADVTHGEVFRSQAVENRPLCHPDGTLVIDISGRDLPDGTAIIQIYASQVAPFQNPCTATDNAPQNAYEALLPALTPPANIAITGSGGGSDGSSFEAVMRFTGDMSIADLAAHYEAQLEAQGWQQTGTSQTEDIAWSGWRQMHAGQEFAVTFYIVRNAGDDNNFTATLRIESVH